MTGKAFNKRKAKPPTPDIGNCDYAANFTDFLERRARGQALVLLVWQPWSRIAAMSSAAA
jgi:hypothetical protein